MMFKKLLLATLAIIFVSTATAANRDVYFNNERGERQHAILFSPVGAPKAAIVFIHGMQSHSEWLRASGAGEKFAEQGILVWAADRQGSGQSQSLRGHATSAYELQMDFVNSVNAFRREALASGVRIYQDIPVHVMANCFGARIAVPYVSYIEQTNQNPFKSLIILAPSTHMREQTNFSGGNKLKIMLSNEKKLFPTTLKDEWFVSRGAGLEWIKNDTLGLRQMTAGFLKATNDLDKQMQKALETTKVPMFVLTASHDQMVDTETLEKDFRSTYKGELKIERLQSEHSIEWGPSQAEYVKQSVNWVLGR